VEIGKLDLVLDVGNSRTKAALFGSCGVRRWTTLGNGNVAALDQWLGKTSIEQVVVGSVAAPQQAWMDHLRGLAPVLEVLGTTRTPLTNRYGTPTTLGVDRLANAVAAAALFPGRAVLVIDAGTCITYDIVECDGIYAGGAIGPGMVLRAKAMHAYSARLPLVVPSYTPNLLGTSTEQSLASGIHHGMVGEIIGFIASLGYQRPGMAVVLTGGDGLRFARAVKSGIFALPLLTLQGLHAILEHHRTLDHGTLAAG
jgi:type III pantothenate kinase